MTLKKAGGSLIKKAHGLMRFFYVVVSHRSFRAEPELIES